MNPDVDVLVTWIGSWDDVASAKEAAVALIRRGADIIIHNTDAASFGVFQAVRQARDAGDDVWAMGMNRDQNDVFPEVILGSAVLRIPEAFLTVARRWRSRELPPGEPYFAGGDTRAADYVVNPVLQDRYSPELRVRLESVRSEIRDGIIDVPRVEFLETGDPSPLIAPRSAASPRIDTGGSQLSPSVEMKGVRKSFGRLVALDGADITAYSGEVHGLVGENGAGKTTLMNVLAGMVRPHGGEVLLGGDPRGVLHAAGRVEPRHRHGTSTLHAGAASQRSRERRSRRSIRQARTPPSVPPSPSQAG